MAQLGAALQGLSWLHFQVPDPSHVGNSLIQLIDVDFQYPGREDFGLKVHAKDQRLSIQAETLNTSNVGSSLIQLNDVKFQDPGLGYFGLKVHAGLRVQKLYAPSPTPFDLLMLLKSEQPHSRLCCVVLSLATLGG